MGSQGWMVKGQAFFACQAGKGMSPKIRRPAEIGKQFCQEGFLRRHFCPAGSV
jgi:hypothetical protein